MSLSFGGLWQNKDFLKLWSGETISIFGSIIGDTALPFAAILVLNASPFQMALLSIAGIVPGLLTGLVAGVWVDRLHRRPILIAADLGRAALLGTIPLAAFLGLLHIAQLYLVAFFVGTLTMFFDVAYQSYLPSLVRREDLIEGNSKLSATASAAEVGGFGVAGWLVQLFTAPMAILIDAVSFLFSAAAVAAIRTAEPVLASKHERLGLRTEVAEGLRAVLGNPLLRATAACIVTLEMGFRMFGTVYLLYVTRELGFPTGLLGMVFAVGGLSSLLGAMLAGRVTGWLGVGRTMAFGLLLYGLSQLLIPLAQGATILALGFLVAQQIFGDGGYTVYEINQMSLRQTITSGRLLGRVNASIRFVGLATMLIGAFLGGLLAETIGLRLTLVTGACGTFLAASWLLLSPVRALKEALSDDVEPAVL